MARRLGELLCCRLSGYGGDDVRRLVSVHIQYLTPPGIPRFLGVWPRHDNNVSLWFKRGCEVLLVRNWEIERQSGLKQHGAAFATIADAWAFLESLLATEGLEREDTEATWGTPGLDEGAEYPVFADDLPVHSFAHLFSAALMDSKRFYQERMLCLAVDGLPDFFLDSPRHYYAGAYIDRGEATYFPVESPGCLYDSARELFGMRAGTLMALATASRADSGRSGEEVLGSLEFWGVGDGSPGAPEVVRNGHEVLRRAHALAEEAIRHGTAALLDDQFSVADNVISMTMKLVQAACMRIMERNVDRAVARFGILCGETHLALAGGFALNCPGNSHLMSRYGFREFVAPPCVNDSGQSIGLALAMFLAAGEPVQFSFPGAYLGPRPGAPLRLGELGVAVTVVTDWDADIFVADVQAGPVAWVEGHSEIGPRALGHRSLLADPTRTEAKDRLNGLKRRQWWRPVAPVVLAERAADWFADAVDSPYMLRTFPIRENRRDYLPAVWHPDDAARIQTVGLDETGWLRSAIEAFDSATGVPMLCNTSLNDAGEPIVETVAEAVMFCLRRGVGILYVDGKRLVIDVENHPVPERPAARAVCQFARLSRPEHEALGALLNPFDLSPVELYAYLERPALRRFDLTVRADADALRAELAGWFAAAPAERDRIAAYLDWVWQRFGPAFEEEPS